MPPSTSIRRRGRPPGRQPAARLQILEAFARVLERAPLSLPSLRKVAKEAGVSPALLHYHFSDLPGLATCLWEERAAPLMQPLMQDLQAAEPNAGAALTRFLQKWTALTLRYPWLMPVLLQSPAPALQPSWSFGGVVRAAVARAQVQGAVRRDLPDHYIALLLLSLGAMPHLAKTVLAVGIDAQPLVQTQGATTLALLHLSVLQAGVAGTQSPRQDSTS
jgi:TetR/AcrR family transcriptional regulator